MVDDGERDSDDVAPTAHGGERALVDDGERDSDDAAPTAAGAGERASGPAAAVNQLLPRILSRWLVFIGGQGTRAQPTTVQGWAAAAVGQRGQKTASLRGPRPSQGSFGVTVRTNNVYLVKLDQLGLVFEATEKAASASELRAKTSKSAVLPGAHARPCSCHSAVLVPVGALAPWCSSGPCARVIVRCSCPSVL